MAIETWNIEWKGAKMFGIEFKTDVDEERTVHEQRDKLKSLPDYDWLIRVPKKPSNYLALRNFFEARFGKWNAFYWKWDSTIDPAGDNVTYLVRFNIDRFEFTDDDKYWFIPIVRVFTDE